VRRASAQDARKVVVWNACRQVQYRLPRDGSAQLRGDRRHMREGACASMFEAAQVQCREPRAGRERKWRSGSACVQSECRAW